jgi:hypothetical protein
MRTNCRYYESRTYPTGDTVRKCDLDLAPEAPWRCPDNCPKFEGRQAGVAWSPGSLIAGPAPAEPASVGDGEGVARLLDEAEDIVNAAGGRILAEVEAEQRPPAKRGLLSRLFRRRS